MNDWTRFEIDSDLILNLLYFETVILCEVVNKTNTQVSWDIVDNLMSCFHYRAVDQLNNYEYQGSVLKVDYVNNGRPRNNMNGRPRNQGGNNNSRGSGYPLRLDFPLSRTKTNFVIKIRVQQILIGS